MKKSLDTQYLHALIFIVMFPWAEPLSKSGLPIVLVYYMSFRKLFQNADLASNLPELQPSKELRRMSSTLNLTIKNSPSPLPDFSI